MQEPVPDSESKPSEPSTSSLVTGEPAMGKYLASVNMGDLTAFSQKNTTNRIEKNNL
jgi:hypothetical protein